MLFLLHHPNEVIHVFHRHFQRRVNLIVIIDSDSQHVKIRPYQVFFRFVPFEPEEFRFTPSRIITGGDGYAAIVFGQSHRHASSLFYDTRCRLYLTVDCDLYFFYRIVRRSIYAVTDFQLSFTEIRETFRRNNFHDR